jgi:uncharacterized membrane protein YkvA (DUF1232 family)
MGGWAWAGTAVAAAALLALVVVVARNRERARAVAGLVPDCAVLLGRLARDPSVPRRLTVVLAAATAYLLFPIDLVPDFLPVVGHLDDALVAVLALRMALRAAGPEAVAAHWPGPPSSLAAIMRLAS